MASRSSPSGKRRRPGQRTEKERRASQGAAGAGRGAAAGRGGGRFGHGSRGPAPKPPGPVGAGGPQGDTPGAGGTPAGASHLADSHSATPAGATLIYGRNPVREALRGRRRIHTVWLSSGRPGEELQQAVAGWAAGAGSRPPEMRFATPSQLAALVGSPDHQGIVAAVDSYAYVEPETLLHDFTLLIALDGVQDPHNLGAIIRSAEGAGAAVAIPRHRSTEVTAAVVKASAGATEHAGIAQVRNLADFLGSAKEAGFWVYGAAAGAASDYTAQDYRYPTVFVVGSEGQGLGHRVELLCDVMVSLPLTGRIDSLNVSVSAGILLYEAVRQRRAAAGAEGTA